MKNISNYIEIIKTDNRSSLSNAGSKEKKE